MSKWKNALLALFLAALLFALSGCSDETLQEITQAIPTLSSEQEPEAPMDPVLEPAQAELLPDEAPTVTTDSAVSENDAYYDLEHVVLYLDQYGHLPENFLTKAEARALGWEGGSVEPYQAGAAIGGDRFGNREGQLPEAAGRSYTECDLDTLGQSGRGAKRLVFSNDGLYFYTEDHYETFSEVIVTEEHTVSWK